MHANIQGAMPGIRQLEIGHRTPESKTSNYTGAMSIDSIPNFTKPALALWSRISTEHKKLLLANVWCGACRHGVTITNFTGAVKSGDLLLVGKCAECHGDVARVIESA
jgi:hypothetical protein